MIDRSVAVTGEQIVLSLRHQPSYVAFNLAGWSASDGNRMSLFLVVAEVQQPALDAAIETLKGSKKWTSRSYFVPFDGTAESLTARIVAAPEVMKTGLLVIRVAADYYGYSATTNWDWLADTFRDENDG